VFKNIGINTNKSTAILFNSTKKNIILKETVMLITEKDGEKCDGSYLPVLTRRD
jgi:hypothetical protein